MNDDVGVEVKILDDRVLVWGMPTYHSAKAAAIDLYACVPDPIALEPQAPALLVPSGLSVHIGDPNVVGIIVPRSGLGHRRGLVLGNLVGVLDADYTGPLMVSLWNRSASGSEPILVAPGDRIAQLLFVPILRPTLTVVSEFSQTSERGGKGFGSTGGSKQLL